MKFSRELLKTKLKATGVHLSMSLIIFFILAYQIYYHWYPQPYFAVDGGWQGIRIVAAVDLVLGPLITFLIFDLAKSRRAIVFDLVVIAVVQIGALAYGVVTTYQQRPVAIVLIDDFTVPAIAADYRGQLESLDQLSRYSKETPPIINAELPLNREILNRVTRIKLEQKIPEHAQLELYQPVEGLQDALVGRQTQFFTYMEQFKETSRFEAWLAQNNRSREDVLVAQFNGRYGRLWLVFDHAAKYIGSF